MASYDMASNTCQALARGCRLFKEESAVGTVHEGEDPGGATREWDSAAGKRSRGAGKPAVGTDG